MEIAAAQIGEFERFAAALPDAVLAVADDGTILAANPRAEELFGYRRGELVGTSVEQLVPEAPRAAHEVDRERFLTEGTDRPMGTWLDLRAVGRDGTEIPVGISLAPLALGDRTVVIASIRDLRGGERLAGALRAVVEGTATATGEGFFAPVVEQLALALGVRHAFVGQLVDGGAAVETLAFWRDGRLAPNATYPLAGTPCETIVGTSLRAFPGDVRALFPGCSLLEQLDAESYVGTPLLSPGGEQLGIVAVLDDKPMYNPASVESILRIFAARAGAELERLRAVRMLGEAERRLRTVFEEAQIGICLIDLEGRAVESNRAFQEFVGYSGEEIRALRFTAYTHPDDVPANVALWQELLDCRRDRYELTKRYVRKDGEVVWGHLIVSVVRDARGSPSVCFSLIQDVTKARAVDEALRRSATRFELAAEALDTAIYEWDFGAQEGLWTGGMTSVFGYPSGEIEPGYDWWLDRVHPDDRERVDRLNREAFATGVPYVAEYRFRARDGSYREVLDRAVRLRDEPARWVGGMVDITDLRRLERQLHQTQRLEAIGRLAGGVAHDFNNLLTGILGYVELLGERVLNDTSASADLREIRKAAERAASLTSQLLAFSRRQLLEPRVVDVDEVIGDLRPMLGRLLGEDIVLIWLANGNPVRVRADPSQLEQVIVNLAVNARDAMPTGGTLRIETAAVELDPAADRLRPAAGPGPHVAITVADDGEGMDADTAARAFEPFFTTKPEGYGTGLGLATVYGIVEQSGGHITIASEPGRGTTFEILLPRVSDPVEPEARPVPAGPGSETVLVVEDDDLVRRLVSRILRQAGYGVREARSGDEALELLSGPGAPPALILTDTVMPGMGGRGLAERTAREHPGLPILFMSGYTDEVIVREGLRDRGLPFLHKPFTPEELLGRVRETLDRAAEVE